MHSVTPNASANSKAFTFIMIPSIGIFWFLFPTNQLYIALSTFSQFPQCVYSREKFILYFSNEAVNLCLFFPHVKTVFRGTPYFVATSLFVNPFSRSFKALHFQPKTYLSVFVLRALSFSKKHLTKNFCDVFFFYQKSNIRTLELSNFDRNVKTKV